MTAAVVAALDVGGSSLKGALVDGDDHLLEGSSITVTRAQAGEGRELVDAIRRLASALADGARARGAPLLAVGLAVPGIVDEARGVAVSSMILGWHEVPFVTLLSDDLQVPVGFGHDVVTGALAENRIGAARDARDWLYVALGTGLGAAFVYRGEPYRGSRGLGGELAHVVVDESGPQCRCGKRGCAEMFVSGPAIAEAHRQLAGLADPVSAAEVARRACAGDGAAQRTWRDTARALAIVLAGHLESADPERVVIGGGVAQAGPLLFEPLGAELARRVRYAVPLVPVVPAALGARSALHGAAILAREAEGRSR